MTSLVKVIGLAATFALGGAIASQASVVDFTDSSLTATATGFTGTTSEGITWNLDGIPPAAIYGDSVPADALVALNGVGLVGEVDGVGIGDDEVNGSQSLVLSFSEDVQLSMVYFLDLFQAPDGSDFEQVTVSNGTDSFSYDAEVIFPTLGGFGSGAITLTGSSFTFDATGTNDTLGVGDFALAGVEISAVPLPAGLLLLGSAFGGLAMVRRKKA